MVTAGALLCADPCLAVVSAAPSTGVREDLARVYRIGVNVKGASGHVMEQGVHGFPVSQYPPGVVLAATVGSHAYGLATPTSDVDTLGVFVADTVAVLGVAGVAVTDATVTHADPDAAFHELGKFVRLALKANPTVLELLYANSFTVNTGTGRSLVQVRDAFLSTVAVRASYGGYARSQAARIRARAAAPTRNDARIAKHARHCVRLLDQGQQLLTTGQLTLDVSASRDELFAAGQLAVNAPDKFDEYVENLFARFDRTESVLAAQPDRDAVNDCVVGARLNALQHR